MSGLIWPVREQLLRLRDGSSKLQERAEHILLKWSNPPEDPAEWLDMMLQSDRLAKIAAVGRENDAVLIKKLLEETEPKHWQDIPALNVPEDRQRGIAEHMLTQVSLFPDNTQLPNRQTSINGSFPYRNTLEHVVRLTQNTHATFDVTLHDAAFDNALINAIDTNAVEQYGKFVAARLKNTEYSLNFYVDPEESVVGKMDPSKANIIAEARKPFRGKCQNDEVRWCLTELPSRLDAQIDKMDYNDYIRYYFDACDQPWAAIHKAQAKLIAALNPGKELHFTNNDGTDVHIPIKDHTFANSVVQRNLPGSEIFSGPDTKSVNGIVVAKGDFAYALKGEIIVMKDLTLHIKDGEVVEAYAAEGEEGLNRILAFDDGKDPSNPEYRGARRIGEVGIGTNSFVDRQFTNTMLVEKTGGSFHLAVGQAYGNTYLKEPVMMDNGNRSIVHWDITTMLRGKEGKIYLDGHLLQDNGKWVACPELDIREEDVAVLNEGWKAIPNHLRPERWRDEAQAQQSQR